MARKSHSSRSRGSGNNGSKATLWIILGIVFIAIVGGLVWWLTGTEPDTFDRADLDKYIERQDSEQSMPDAYDVYFDFSDGMQLAYQNDDAKTALKAILNKITPTAEKISYYSLANDKITPIEGTQTSIYNRVTNNASYNNTNAPIEATLDSIVRAGKPALLVTDFEEYNNKIIQQQAYASRYFEQWLKNNGNITFYVFDYTEKTKAKHLYFTVFDAAQNELLSNVDKAIADRGLIYQRFNLGASYFPTKFESSLGADKGGNYHNDKGVDAVTSVNEDGGAQAYKQYMHAAEWKGVKAQYYPIRLPWKDVISNAKSFKEANGTNKFTHLITNAKVDLSQQDAYKIEDFDVNVYNMQPVINAFKAKKSEPQPELVPDMFKVTADIANGKEATLSLDLDNNFTGEVKDGADTDLYRVDVVVKKATPRYDRLEELFLWDGNSSLCESVRNVLQNVSPENNVVWTYYIKRVK